MLNNTNVSNPILLTNVFAADLQSMWAERSGEQSVRNIVGARSEFLTKGRSDRSVSLRFRSDTAHTTSLGHAKIHPECCVLIFLSAPMLTD